MMKQPQTALIIITALGGMDLVGQEAFGEEQATPITLIGLALEETTTAGAQSG